MTFLPCCFVILRRSRSSKVFMPYTWYLSTLRRDAGHGSWIGNLKIVILGCDENLWGLSKWYNPFTSLACGMLARVECLDVPWVCTKCRSLKHHLLVNNGKCHFLSPSLTQCLLFCQVRCGAEGHCGYAWTSLWTGFHRGPCPEWAHLFRVCFQWSRGCKYEPQKIFPRMEIHRPSTNQAKCPGIDNEVGLVLALKPGDANLSVLLLERPSGREIARKGPDWKWYYLEMGSDQSRIISQVPVGLTTFQEQSRFWRKKHLIWYGTLWHGTMHDCEPIRFPGFWGSKLSSYCHLESLLSRCVEVDVTTGKPLIFVESPLRCARNWSLMDTKF